MYKYISIYIYTYAPTIYSNLPCVLFHDLIGSIDTGGWSHGNPTHPKSPKSTTMDGAISDFFSKRPSSNESWRFFPTKNGDVVFSSHFGDAIGPTVQLECCKLDSLERRPFAFKTRVIWVPRNQIHDFPPLDVVIRSNPHDPQIPKSHLCWSLRFYRKPNAWFHLSFQDFKSKSCCSQTNTILDTGHSTGESVDFHFPKKRTASEPPQK